MYSWTQIIVSLTESGPTSVARIPVPQMQHPRDAGIAQTFGSPHGQRASYRALLTDGSTLCIEQFDASYEAHLEPPSLPQPPPTLGAQRSVGAESIAGFAALGALLGLAIGGRKESALTGALLGGVSGLATIAVNEADRSPETTKTALELAKAMSALVSLSAAPRRTVLGNVGRKRSGGGRKI